ncbi:hypothetical protein DVA67_026715 [Solirubrobacter sp. CPCC 204708]|uniref:Lipoprotein n=1 Tax=Solirubrobacter deserti TaxID=2282478 RepID=A0ABT4RGM6_9ACTN|nr:hypothetical protein [Solirubrobacter deserti]MBE2319589.1 hypothetical protein [Solirubrobacter deserti]MDA0137672.1 hypothetical protein [Solirubrobacter deserti]
MSTKLATVAAVALIFAGCSNEPSPEAPADTGTSASATTDSETSGQSQAMRFSACMRENGVADFPDPDASGELTIDGVLNGSSLDASDPAWKQALAACKALQPSGFTGRKRTPSEQEPALRFAQCIRENGVEDFPDPTPDSPLIDTNRIPSANREGGMAALNAAMDQCRDLGDKARQGR